jgi:mycothiol synthase
VSAPEILSHHRLEAAEISAVQRLVGAVTDADGVTPVSEHTLLHLGHGGDREALNLLARDGAATLVGYAHLDVTDRVEGPSAELAVHPEHRRHGAGAALLAVLEAASEGAGHHGRLRLWAHGRHPGAAALAASRGYVEERALWQMRRSLLSELPAPDLPAGVRLRTFRVGVDEEAWLAVNNRAFASHPDQGGWTAEEIRIREKEPWFDPDGFLLAERAADGALLGFHWTKMHGAGTAGEQHPHEPIGEVYVVGVDPDAQGQGLGPALTLAGLRYLRGRGLSQVMLYVDESNTAARRTYERLGFTRWDVDVRYRRRVEPGTQTALT